MKIFLDDVRIPKDCIHYMHQRIGQLNSIYLEDWAVARNYDEFVDVVEENIDVITHVSFDHDLSDEHYDPSMYEGETEYGELYSKFKEKTGLECAKWFKDYYDGKGKKMPVIFVHSMNPVGTQNIINALVFDK